MRVDVVLARPIESTGPASWLDPIRVKVGRDHPIVSVAVIIVVGISTDGRCQVLGMGRVAESGRPRR